MPGRENPRVNLEHPVVRAMRHRALEYIHRVDNYLKDVIFKSKVTCKTPVYQLFNKYI